MKNILLAVLGLVLVNNVRASDGPPTHDHDHARHYMILMGENEIFASHFVFKQPHNYQVLLSVKFDPATQAKYREEREKHPNELFMLFLDPIVIKDIEHLDSISGKLLVEDKNEVQHEILPAVNLGRDQFKVIFFNEVPLSLERKE
jgi:hypothetical protein